MELEPDVAAADDDQVLGQKIDFHHRRAGQVVDVVHAGHVGNERSRADVDEDLLGLEKFVTHAYGLSGFETAVAAEDGAVVHVREPVGHALVGLAHDGVLARLHLLHVDFDRTSDRYPEVGTATSHVRRAGAHGVSEWMNAGTRPAPW